MMSCYGCNNRKTSICGSCVGWNRYESNFVINRPLAMNIDKEIKMLAKYTMNDIFGIKNVIEEREKDMKIKNVYFNNPVTVVLWEDGTKTIVRCDGETYDPEKGLAMAIAKKAFGNQGNYYKVFKEFLPPMWVMESEDEFEKEHKDKTEDIRTKLSETAEKKAKNYVDVEYYARYVGLKKETVQKKCRLGQIEGAKKVGGKWMIPYTF